MPSCMDGVLAGHQSLHVCHREAVHRYNMGADRYLEVGMHQKKVDKLEHRAVESSDSRWFHEMP